MIAAARWLSIVAHPFVMVSLMVATAASAKQPVHEAVRTVALVVVVTIIPLAALMIARVRSGAWENADASNKQERPFLYVAGLVLLAGLLVYLIAFRPRDFMTQGVIGTLGMFAACALATRWIKVSLHMAFAALASTVLVLMGSAVGYVLAVALPFLAWARLLLSRHTPAEVAFGAVIGACAGAAIYYL